MGKQAIQERKRLAAVFASFAVLIFGTASLVQTMAIDYYSVTDTLTKVLPESFIIGGLGWVMGMILDQPKKRRKSSYHNLVSELMKNEAQAIHGAPELMET